MKLIKAFMFSIFIIVSVNCGETKKTIDSSNPTDITGNYRITKIGETLHKPDELKIRFSSLDNSFSGNTGCNSFFGGYTLNLNTIQFSDIAATEKYCDEDVMIIERGLFSAIANTGSYSIKNNILTLFSKIDKSEILVAILDSKPE